MSKKTKELNPFQQVLFDYLTSRAENDALFAETFKKESKNIQDCETYILNHVKSTGRSGFADEEIFSLAVHYYDEDEIKLGNPVKAKVVINKEIKDRTNVAPAPTKKPKEPKAKDVDNFPHEQLSMF